MKLRITDKRTNELKTALEQFSLAGGKPFPVTTALMGGLLADHAEMRAEIKRLGNDLAYYNGQTHHDECNHRLCQEWRKVRAENERLRAALNEIKGFTEGCGCSMPCRCWGVAEINKETIFQMAEIAITALETSNAKVQ